MYNTKKHPYHIVEISFWPILVSLAALLLVIGVVTLIHGHHGKINYLVLVTGLTLLLYSLYRWWRDVIYEGRIEKQHNPVVQKGLRIGMVLFILSEVMIFASLFGAFFYARFFPPGILDGVWVSKSGVWPPHGIITFDPWSVPFMNTLILLLSGTTVTWAHYSIQENDQLSATKALGLTVLLGMWFTAMQAFEYFHAPFKFADGIYASNFYILTGFHGFHVIIGTIFLAVCYFRSRNGHFASPNNHLGFEFAAWYWHFVDVVWIFLFVFVYVLEK